MYNCENCGYKTGKIFETDAENYPKNIKSKKGDKIFVCKRCFDEWDERNYFTEKIIESKKEDRKIILAGPGTGKTYAFQRYIEEFDKKDSIYITTFINNLVDDLKKDLGKNIEERNIEVSTFHKFCYRLLKLVGKDCDYCPDLTDLIIEDIGVIKASLINEERLRKNLNNYKATHDIKLYFERGNYYNAIGNDNIFFALLKVLEARGGIDLSKYYRQIIIDEYQDFNFAESSIIKIISRNNKILIAGDDDQALYTFKGSDPKYIRELWESTEFYKLELPFCQRCTEVIIDSFHCFIKQAQARGLLQDRKAKKYKYYFPDKYRDSKKYHKIFWYRTSIRNKKFESIVKILVNNIVNYTKEKEIIEGKLNFLIICPRERNSMCKTIKERVIEELKKLGLPIIDCERKSKKDSLLIRNGYGFLENNKKSNLGWRIIIKNDPLEGWEEIIKNTGEKAKNIFDLLPPDYKNRHLKFLEKLGEEQIVESKNKEGLNLLFTNFCGAKGLSADHVFVLFPQNGIFPSNPSNINNDEIYKFLVALTRSRKSLNLITIFPHRSEFIEMLPRANIRVV